MGAPTAARVAALDILGAVRAGALGGPAFDAAVACLDDRDRAWTRELVFGTFRLRGRLDHRLAALSSRPLESLDADILDILRLGAYQLGEMQGVPAYAAVSQSVDLARRAGGRGAAGFVNGVLQSLRRVGGASTFPAFEADPAGFLTTWGSHPEWLVRRWLARFGAESTRRLVDANNRRPELYLRVFGDVEGARSRLRSAGAEVLPVPGAPRALQLIGGDITAALAAAPSLVQDPAAGLVVSYAAVAPGHVVVDLAAAPGGKTLAMACDVAPEGPVLVVASDLSRQRLRRLEENTARLNRQAPAGLAAVPVALLVADGRRPPFRAADVVLLDAPCTGTGTLRRHPDGRWRIGPRDLRSLAALQKEMLDAAAGIVAEDGLLVYSTCSLEPEENEEQVASFLVRQPEFSLERGPALEGGVVQPDGTLSVLPQDHGWDGAFAARLRRRSGSHAG
ncbi:16S rRNA (cytosine(967)-C(5))-methyltransferase RsmB [soil metagenome]